MLAILTAISLLLGISSAECTDGGPDCREFRCQGTEYDNGHQQTNYQWNSPCKTEAIRGDPLCIMAQQATNCNDGVMPLTTWTSPVTGNGGNTAINAVIASEIGAMDPMSDYKLCTRTPTRNYVLDGTKVSTACNNIGDPIVDGSGNTIVGGHLINREQIEYLEDKDEEQYGLGDNVYFDLKACAKPADCPAGETCGDCPAGVSCAGSIKKADGGVIITDSTCSGAIWRYNPCTEIRQGSTVVHKYDRVKYTPAPARDWDDEQWDYGTDTWDDASSAAWRCVTVPSRAYCDYNGWMYNGYHGRVTKAHGCSTINFETLGEDVLPSTDFILYESKPVCYCAMVSDDEKMVTKFPKHKCEGVIEVGCLNAGNYRWLDATRDFHVDGSSVESASMWPLWIFLGLAVGGGSGYAVSKYTNSPPEAPHRPDHYFSPAEDEPIKSQAAPVSQNRARAQLELQQEQRQEESHHTEVRMLQEQRNHAPAIGVGS